ncbi:MAG: YihY/virulence factor BrkB family protein [Chitinophagaceae bacterium]
MGHHVTPKGIWEVLKSSFKGFAEDKVPKLSASLAYYTSFSLAPLLIMIIYLCSIFLGREAIEGTIYTQINGFVGKEAAEQIQGIIKSATLEGKGGFAAIIGIITLLIGATTVFAEIQDSINSIWGLKAKPKLGIKKLLKDRFLSFGIIGSLGFLLLVSLGVSAIVDGLGERLKDNFPDVTVVVFYVINLLLTLFITTGLFGVIFKVLPDAKIKWKDVFGGALATSVLFMIGKLLISLYISKSDVGGAFGAAGSLVILIVWIYYSAIILYFGAEFTKAYAVKYGSAIHPSHYAITIKKVEVEGGNRSVQQMDNVDVNNLPKKEYGPYFNHKAHNKHIPKPQMQFEKEQPPLGMLNLIQALGVAAIAKIADLGKNEKPKPGS